MEQHRPQLGSQSDSNSLRRAIDGNIVGEQARAQLGEDFIWPETGEDKAGSAGSAAKLLLDPVRKAAAEVPMVRCGLYARADALVPVGDAYALRETKASTFPLKSDKTTPGAPKKHHLNDVAIQVWAMDGMALPYARAELNLLNSQWRYPGGGDYSGLFRQLDVSSEIVSLKEQVPIWLEQAHKILSGDMPEVVTGKQCSDPYECPFIGYCENLDPPGPDHPIELLPDLEGKKLARTLKEGKGYTSILDPRPEELVGKQADLYRRIQAAHRDGRGILEADSAAELAGLPYPRYYFDFEGIDLPVPRWKGVRPYEQIPFQWSCHIERLPGTFEHAEFLDLTGNDPSLACIRRMRETINPTDGGPIVVYYSAYERQRLLELAVRYPEHLELLTSYIERLFDLHPVVKKSFYHPEMQGSFSIKKVLPVVAPDLNYDELVGVQEGTGAQIAYLFAALDPSVTKERKAEIEDSLRRYCRQDTWAMVELAYFLTRRGRPARPIEH